MWEYIVMGQIPGTQFEVSFNTWLFLVVTPLIAWTLYKLSRPTRELAASARHSELFVVLRISYVIQTAAYLQLLTSRRHIQA